jgi:hypothetical protein
MASSCFTRFPVSAESFTNGLGMAINHGAPVSSLAIIKSLRSIGSTVCIQPCSIHGTSARVSRIPGLPIRRASGVEFFPARGGCPPSFILFEQLESPIDIACRTANICRSEFCIFILIMRIVPIVACRLYTCPSRYVRRGWIYEGDTRRHKSSW